MNVTRPPKAETMGRRIAEEFCCDRCKAVWYVDVDSNAPQSDLHDPHLTVRYMSEEWRFDVLCDSCKKTCKNYVDNLLKNPRAKKKSEGKAKKEKAVKPPPSKDMDII